MSEQLKVPSSEQLVERGCICGGDHDGPFTCPVHPEPGDNRGIAAYFKAGLPLGFPMVAYCAKVLTRDADGRALTICGTEGLMYPDINIDDPKRPFDPDVPCTPTLICPRCSGPKRVGAALERHLVADAEQFGYLLNDGRVFA